MNIENILLTLNNIIYKLRNNQKISNYTDPDHMKLYTYGLQLKVLGQQFINLSEKRNNQNQFKNK